MNELELFYKEAGILSDLVNKVKQMTNIQNEVKMVESPPQGKPDTVGFVEQKEITQTDGNGEQTKSYENDATINFVLQNLKKEMGDVLSHLGNVSISDIESALSGLNSMGNTKIEDLAKDPSKLEKLNEHYNIVANIMPVFKRISEIFAHEKEHLNVGDNEAYKDEDAAHAAEHGGSEQLLQSLKSKYPNLDQKIKDIQDFLEQVGSVSSQLKTSKDRSKSYGFSVRSSIINRDIKTLIKVSNELDKHEAFVAADLVDSIVEDLIR